MSIQPDSLKLSPLPVKKTRRIQRRKKFRNVNLRALKDAGQILLVVFVKDVQSGQLKVNLWCKELPFLSKAVEGLLLSSSLFNLFFSTGSHMNYESPWCLDKTSLAVWLRLAILGLLITKITWSIYRLFDPNKLYYFTLEITRETILEV